MPQIFGPSANTLAKLSLVVLVFLVAGGLCAVDIISRSPYVRYTRVPFEQPVPFSHKHHSNLGIDCRYCHTSVEESHFANVPPTRICMNCHNQIWNEAPMLEPVRASWQSGESLEWNRVHDLPDFVYFNHSIHVNRGIGCAECHGRVDLMPLTWREQPLMMLWCLECHRNPSQFIRPREEVTNMAWEWPQGKQSTDAMAQLAAAYDIKMPMEVEALMKSHPDMLDAEQVEHVVQAARQSLVQSYGIDLSNHRLTDCWICHR